MSRTLQERVDYALSSLIEHIIPEYPNDDDAQAERRLDDAYNLARETLADAGDPAVTSDVHHAADLIKKQLVRDNNTPEKALKFSHLYSRLLSQPVINQKWAVLYFLHQLSEPPKMPILSESRPSVSNRLPPSQPPTRHDTHPLSPSSSKKQSERQFVVDSPAFNDAFSTTGLRRLPVAEALNAPRAERPISRHRKERPREEKLANGEHEAASTERSGAWLNLAALEPSESAMLRDLPFTLQGLSSSNFSFSSKQILQLPSTLPAPLIGLLHTLAEPCLLYRNIQAFVESSEGGLIGQSFRSALGMELRSYLGLVGTLEGHIRRALATLDADQSRQGIGKAGVTLKRCVIWTRDATMGLRLMSMMVEQSRDKKGGQLLSVVHSFALTHGDPFVVTFAEKLLAHITRPFYDMLQHWIYDGELSDPYLEFFVSEQHDDLDADMGDPRKVGATSVWEEKYKLNSLMVPTIITESFANKVFLIGKSLNFIRHGCGDAGWVESYSKTTTRELRYGDIATLETSIDEAYKTTMARLINLMNTKFHLPDHLSALKKYLLLGSGDFIAVLMESLSSALDRPANTQYRHTLTAQLEHAVRNSNAQYDSPDVLRRLDSRMLELSHGEIGWDVFTLEYKISPPVDVIVTPHASKQYLKVFNFLWRVKRVEFALGSTWRRCMTGARSFLSVVGDKLDKDWKVARCVVAEMVHFVNQLQYYILFEVIESSWAQLQAAIHKPESTLDDLIQAHAAYLTAITRKGLLGSGGSGPSTSDFTAQLHELLKTMLAYKDAVDGLYSFSVAEFTRRQEVSAKIETRTAAGKWGLSERDRDDDADPSTPGLASRLADGSPLLTHIPGLPGGTSKSSDEATVLASLRTRLTTLSSDFKARVNLLLGELMAQPDTDMRWLAMVMNFNDVYQPVRRRRKTMPGSTQGTVERSGRGSVRDATATAPREKKAEKVDSNGGPEKRKAKEKG